MATFEAIASATVSAGGASSIVFSSIPQTYQDLVIKFSGRTNDSGNYTDIDITFNGETARQWLGLYAVTTSVGSSTNTAFNIIGPATGNSATASVFSNDDIYICNYTSTAIKPIISEGIAENNSATNFNVSLASNIITNGAAVTSITLVPFSPNTFLQYSTAYLYGIKNS